MKSILLIFTAFYMLTYSAYTKTETHEEKISDVPKGLYELYGESVVDPENDDYGYIRLNFDESKEISGYFKTVNGTFIDSNGREYDDISQEELKDYENLPTVFFENGKYGYKNSEGEVVIPAQYYLANEFSDRLAAVCREFGGCLEYINEKGETVLTLEDVDGENSMFTMFPDEPDCDFSDGIAMISGGEFYIDKAGNRYIVSSENFKACGKYSNRLIAGYDPKTGLYGYADLDGNIVVPCQYKWARDFLDCGVALVFLPGEFDPVVGSYQGCELTYRGYINSNNQTVIPLEYYDAFYSGASALYPTARENDGIIMLYKDGYTFYFRYDGTLLGKSPHMDSVFYDGERYNINLSEYYES